jgi:hypothetical protein
VGATAQQSGEVMGAPPQPRVVMEGRCWWLTEAEEDVRVSKDTRKTTMKGSRIRPTLWGGGEPQVCCLPMLVVLMWRPNFLFGMIDGLRSGHG